MQLQNVLRDILVTWFSKTFDKIKHKYFIAPRLARLPHNDKYWVPAYPLLYISQYNLHTQ